MYLDCGEYYVIDVRHNCIVKHDIDLEQMGREYEVLKQWEELGFDLEGTPQ